ncbi:carbohydrate diacid regulator [Bacillus sp. V3-13]|uniref:CdaR family transcriptional regulator n=1 Tax=Bacillus sp. V3-13 TaxID=2053728 RepID=UPI000C76C441|nr:sugar diacid recognition domain-containing protein [Bacillus sp. V3-13]PLR76099.1 carbohydrate diacid regulator [Bacillus sp. V3-13]
MLMPGLAEKIIIEVRKLLNEDIIVANPDGTIIASTDPVRVGTFHEGAFLVFKRKAKRIITKEDETRLTGVKAGINLPIFFKKEVIGIIGITGNPDKVSPFGEIIRKMTELLISENYYAEQLEIQSRAMEAFVFDWMQIHEWDSSFLDRAKLLHIDVTIPRRVLLGEIRLPESISQRELGQSLKSLNEDIADDIIIRWGNERILWLSAESSNHSIKQKISKAEHFWKKQYGASILIGVGQRAAPGQIHHSYRQALRALKSALVKETVVFDEDLTFEMILDDIKSETKSAFLQRTINPLLDEEELLLTLKELFRQNHSLKNTAAALHIHINTLHYRLKKINDLTGLDPSSIEDLLSLFLAIVILDEHTKI